MTRRLLCALAAFTVFAFGSIVWASPAQAAPGGACSLEEWRADMTGCIGRLGDAVDSKTGCVTAPTPGSPASGMPGWFSATQPDAALRDGVLGPYSRYGTGGYGLDTFDLGCLGTVKHPDLTAWNMAASTEFSFAASTMGFANSLRERAYDPGSMWDWADGFLEEVTTAIYRYVFNIFGAISLAILGLFLVWQSRVGNMSRTVQLTAWALFVIVATTGVAKYPVRSAHVADTSAQSLLGGLHSIVGPRPQNIPADQCVLGGQACVDSRPVAVRASDVAVDAVLYKPWLRAMLGTADSQTALKYGPALYDATTLSWGEATRADQSPELRKQLIEHKAQDFNKIAEQIRTEDPLAYEHLQGIHGNDRFGSGLVALLSAFVFAFFDVIASVIILLGFGLFRYAIIAFPLLATFGVFMPASGPLRRVMNMSATAFVNIVVFGAAAGVYLTAMSVIFSSTMPGFVQIVVLAMTAVLMLKILRPDRRFLHAATGRSRPGRITQHLRAKYARSTSDQVVPVSPAPAGAGTEAQAVPNRPENAPSRPRRGARPHPISVTAAATPAQTRPETTPAPAAATATATTTKRRPSPRPSPRPENRS